MENNTLKETRNSDLWLFFVFLGFFNNFIFYYIGIKSKYQRYIQYGHFYTFIWFLFIFSLILKDQFFSTCMLLVYIFSYIAGIFLGLLSKKYYNYRLILLKEAASLNLVSKKIDITDNYDLYYLINSKVPESASVFEEHVSF